MRHHRRDMANADPVKPINGKKLVLALGLGSVLFTAVMGFGTYLLAQVMTPLLQKHSPSGTTQGAIPVESHKKPSN